MTPHLVRWERDLGPHGVGIQVIVSGRGTLRGPRRELRRAGAGYRVLFDPKGENQRRFGVRGLPALFLLDADGVVRWQGSAGRTALAQLEERLSEILDPGEWRALDEVLGVRGEVRADGSYVLAGPSTSRLPDHTAFVGTLADATVIGDLAASEHAVQLAIDALRAGDFEIVALHEQRTSGGRRFILHYQARGEARALARTLGGAHDRIDAARPGTARSDGGRDRLDTKHLVAIVGRPASATTQEALTFELPRKTLNVTLDGRRVGPGAGLACRATFTGGAPSRLSGQLCVKRDELQRAIDALRKAGIAVTAINAHLLGEQTRMIFVRFEAAGNAERRAWGIREVWRLLER